MEVAWLGSENRQRIGCRIVTYNGKGFDLPVLRARAMRYGISARARFNNGDGRFDNYTYRYSSDWHCDLMELFSDYKAAPSMRLEEVAAAAAR